MDWNRCGGGIQRVFLPVLEGNYTEWEFHLVATRYDKLASRVLSFVQLACIRKRLA